MNNKKNEIKPHCTNNKKIYVKKINNGSGRAIEKI
jgi:hypothetical protein